MEVVNIVWIIVGLLITLAIAYYIYIKKYKIADTEFVPNSEYTPKDKKYECILFHTEWCPHCKKTMKDWIAYTLNKPNENAIYTTYDCDKNIAEAEFYEIDSYPTIIMLYKGKKYIFDSNFNEESMDKFVSTILKI